MEQAVYTVDEWAFYEDDGELRAAWCFATIDEARAFIRQMEDRNENDTYATYKYFLSARPVFATAGDALTQAV